jgi:hypothetical protein
VLTHTSETGTKRCFAFWQKEENEKKKKRKKKLSVAFWHPADAEKTPTLLLKCVLSLSLSVSPYQNGRSKISYLVQHSECKVPFFKLVITRKHKKAAG